VSDANDLDQMERALKTFRKTEGSPTFIVLDSHIGYGSPHKQDTSAAHGEPLGEDEIRLTKRSYGWPEDASSWCQTGFMTTSIQALGRVAIQFGIGGRNYLRHIVVLTRNSHMRST
jgi:transketolase